MNTEITLQEICERIELQPEVMQQVLAYEDDLEKLWLRDKKVIIEGLQQEALWESTRQELKKRLGEDSRGIKILTCMLQCSRETYQNYKHLGICDAIFNDTMKCFTRFVQEHKNSYGCYGFDRDFWTTRQLSACLFRIGVLEYEMTEYQKAKVISIHIPSDAALQREGLRESCASARAFFTETFPAYATAKMMCGSWLLAPSLQEILHKDSNILQFQNAFEIVHVDEESTEFMEWVYKKNNIPLEELPEETSLQRNMKRYLEKGGKVGEAIGFLREPAFK